MLILAHKSIQGSFYSIWTNHS